MIVREPRPAEQGAALSAGQKGWRTGPGVKRGNLGPEQGDAGPGDREEGGRRPLLLPPPCPPGPSGASHWRSELGNTASETGEREAAGRRH